MSRVRKSIMVLSVLLTLVSLVPHVALRAQDGTPAATMSGCVPTVSVGPSSDANVRQQVILDEMRGHLLVSLDLWQAGKYAQAAVHAGHPSTELMPVIAGDLRRACLFDDFTKALTGYVELASKAGDKAPVEKAQGAILAMLDQVSASMIPADSRSDLVFNFRVVAGVLSDVHSEYVESYKDGKIAVAADYEDSVGFYQVASARYDAIKAALMQKYPDLAKALEPSWKALSDALSSVKAPESPVDPKAVSGAVDGLTNTVAKTLNVTLEAKFTPLEYLNNAQRGLNEALELYEKGENDDAYEEAASAYLDQFENAEVPLAARDKELMETIEGQMKDFRDAIKAGKPAADVKALLAKITPNIDKAISLLSQ